VVVAELEMWRLAVGKTAGKVDGKKAVEVEKTVGMMFVEPGIVVAGGTKQNGKDLQDL